MDESRDLGAVMTQYYAEKSGSEALMRMKAVEDNNRMVLEDMAGMSWTFALEAAEGSVRSGWTDSASNLDYICKLISGLKKPWPVSKRT